MSGHSKWSTIKRQKGVTDAKRSASFTRVANFVALVAREGGGDPNTNYRLKIAIEQARSVNMPKENIERAIKRGTGELGGAQIESAMYEVYGPGGVGFLIEAATDNKNRTISDLKQVLNKNGGKQASSGSVQFLFLQKGRIIATYDKDTESGELAIIESEADDYSNDEHTFFIYTKPTELTKIKLNLEERNFVVEEAQLVWEPNDTIKITDPNDIAKIEKLNDALEELDDATGVYHNGEIE